MSEIFQQTASTAPSASPASGRGRGIVQKIRQHAIVSLALAICLMAGVYWGLVASDRYVSEAQIIIQRTDLHAAPTIDFGAMLGGSSSNRPDQMLLRTHLLSVDMLAALDAKLDLRTHYSDSSHDWVSRLKEHDATMEEFHEYVGKMIAVEFDDYAGVLLVRVQAFEPKMAHLIASMLVEEGERKMNGLAHQLAQDQVDFVERQVTQMAARLQQARQAVLDFQNAKGLVSPQGTAESLASIVNRLEAQRTDLKAQRTALLGYLAPTAPGMVELDLQIAAVDKQLEQEQARLTSPKGRTLNKTVEEYQRLELAAKFAEDAYKTALVALEKGRMEASRTVKKVSVLQQPTMPQQAVEPRRLYNFAVFVLAIMLITGVLSLLAAIIRDHKD